MIEKIKDAFGECKNQLKCDCLVKSSYETYKSKKLFIYDDPNNNEQPIKLVDEKSEHQLIVENLNEKDVIVIKNDNCLSEEIKRIRKCDCILTDDEKIFFVEIKDTKLRGRGNARDEAVEQLAFSLSSFKEKILFDEFENCFAVICFKSKSEYPITSRNNNLKEFFREKYNTQFSEGNLISI